MFWVFVCMFLFKVSVPLVLLHPLFCVIPNNSYSFTKIPVELTRHNAFIFLDFVVREKARMNNSKIMLRLFRVSMGEVIVAGRNELGDYYYSTIFDFKVT